MRHVLLLVLILVLAGCPESDGGGSGGGGGPAQPSIVSFETAFDGEMFAGALKLIQHPTLDDQFYVVEQQGMVVRLLESDPAASRAVAVDVATEVANFVSGGEMGLLGMAFDPDFDMNGELFFAYNEVAGADMSSVLARFMSPDGGMTFVPAAADPTVLAIDQPFSNHNGGDIVFGPDGYLYYAMGDGGSAGDPGENGQDINTLLGTIMRLEVSTTPPGTAGNPFVLNGASEIHAFGFRNPWRMSFDRMTGDLWIGDVGQGRQEEIDVIRSADSGGGNYGWDCFEGLEVFNDVEGGPCVPGEILPVVTHSHPSFRSITGGYVYRGSAIPELQGAYVYGDFATGEVRAFYSEEVPTRNISLVPPAGLNVASFAEDRAGELYVLDREQNPATQRAILKIVPAPVP